MGRLRRHPHVPDSLIDSGSPEVRVEQTVIAFALGCSAINLLWSAIVTCVRVNGCDLAGIRGGLCDNDRRPPSVAADFSDLAAAWNLSRAVPKHSGLAFGHPSLNTVN
jgi:hypothetical protein